MAFAPEVHQGLAKAILALNRSARTACELSTLFLDLPLFEQDYAATPKK
jgi:hypothetical protein